MYSLKNEEDLLLNVSSGFQMLQNEGTHDVLDNQLRWRVNSDTLVQKNEILFAVNCTSFPADGITTCVIVCSGFTGSVEVRISPCSGNITLTNSDSTIVLTSNAPKEFCVLLQGDTYWSLPLTVRAV